MRKLVTALALCAALGACTDATTAPEQQFGVSATTGGAVPGAGAGAALGNRPGDGADPGDATAADATTGGLIGDSIGRSLDAADRQATSRTTQTALETAPPDQSLPWQDRQNGHHGTVVPGRYYQAADGQYCREFQQTVTIGGQTRQGFGRACRQPDGSWKIVPQRAAE